MSIVLLPCLLLAHPHRAYPQRVHAHLVKPHLAISHLTRPHLNNHLLAHQRQLDQNRILLQHQQFKNPRT